MPLRHQLRQVPVDEGEQQRRDVIAVGVGVGEDDDLAVAQPRRDRSSCRGRSRCAVTRSDSSLFSSTFASDALSVLSTLPRSGRIACRARSRPCLADPPAESPSTTNSSLPSLRRIGAVAQLAGQVEARRRRALARHLGLRRAARFARPRREDDPRDDRLGDADVVVQPVLERRADHAVDGRQQLGIVQPILGLPLELRLLDEHAQHAGQAFADVLGGQRHAFRRQVVRLDEVADRLAEPGAQAVLVRAARPVGMPFTYERRCSSVASVHCSDEIEAQAVVLAPA